MNFCEYPCSGCIRVADPGACENKLCTQWRLWFLHKWEELQKLFGVTAQSQQDPCRQCPFSQGICLEPCRKKRAWEEGGCEE